MPVKPGYLLLGGIGAVILWSGIQGKSVTGVFRELIGGQPPGNASTSDSIQQESVINPSSLATFGYGSGLNSGSSGTPATGAAAAPVAGGTTSLGQGGTAAQNQVLAKAIAISMGHPSWTTGAEWNDWVALWNRESGWNTHAYYPGTTTSNPDPSGSRAYGIPQSLPPDKMASAGADWINNPATQIKWGIGYIASTYGSPSGAWAHEQSAGWY